MSKGRSSQKRGEEFEILVEKLENLLAKGDIKVKVERNVRILPKVGKRKRQIDVLLRLKEEGVESLVMIECRDRDDAHDLNWIEQINTKRQLVGAKTAVAVTKFGFSEDAVLVAKEFGIILRTVDDITMDEIADWFKLTHVTVIGNITDIHTRVFLISPSAENLTLETKQIVERQLIKASKNINEAHLYLPEKSQPVSLQAIWQRALELNPRIKETFINNLSPQKLSVMALFRSL